MSRFNPGTPVMEKATGRTGIVASFKGAPIAIRYDERPIEGEVKATALLARHADLFHAAKQSMLDARHFVGQGGRLYSVGQTLNCVERELKERGAGVTFGHEAARIDLENILVQRSDWEIQ